MKQPIYAMLFTLLGASIGLLAYLAWDLVSLFALSEPGWHLEGVGAYLPLTFLIVAGSVAGYLEGRVAWELAYGDRLYAEPRFARRIRIIPFFLLIVSVGILIHTLDVGGARTFMSRFSSRGTDGVESSGISQPIHSGIRGIVVIGPLCPAALPEDGEGRPQECLERPYETELAVFKQGKVVKVFSSDVSGSFETLLAPGEYVIGVLPDSPALPRLDPTPVAVSDGAFLELELSFDTGIR